MAVLRGKFLLRGDVWFDEKLEKIPNVDVLYYYYQWTNSSVQGVECDEESTLLLDLTKDLDELWKSIKRQNRYKIRQAEQKDQIVYEFWDYVDSGVLDDFLDFYNRFALQKGLKKIQKTRLKSYADAGFLKLSQVKSKNGKSLVWHVYVCNQNRVFLLYSASIRDSTNASYNQIVGRANRYHHWQDIVKFKNLGIATYDFGGCYADTTDPAKISINQFKKEFGGNLVMNFNCRYGITVKGKLFLLLRRIVMPLLFPSDREVRGGAEPGKSGRWRSPSQRRSEAQEDELFPVSESLDGSIFSRRSISDFRKSKLEE